jgi:hypothetical protein
MRLDEYTSYVLQFHRIRQNVFIVTAGAKSINAAGQEDWQRG